MKKGKRLLVMLLATLVMVTGAFSVAYAAPVTHTSMHDVSASSSGATLSYRCNFRNGSDRCTHYHSSSYEYVTLECDSSFVSDSTIYDGSRHGVTVSGLNDSSIVTWNGVVHYSGTNYDSTTEPMNAGEYTATVSINVIGNGGGTYELTKKFTIAPKEVHIKWGSTDTFVYNGDEQKPTAAVDANDIARPDDEVTVRVTGGATNVGKHTATATLEGANAANYIIHDAGEEDDSQMEFEITAKPVRLTWTNLSLTYNGEEQLPTATVNKADLIGGESCDVETIKAYASDDPTCEGDVQTSKNAGSYYAKAELSANSNYRIIKEGDDGYVAENGAIQSFKISKKGVSLAWSGGPFTYNAQTQEPTLTSDDLDAVEVSYTKGGQAVTSPEPKSAGTYLATATLKDGDNYFFVDGTKNTYEFTIKPYPISVKFTGNSFVYDGTAHEPEVELNKVFDGDDCEPVITITGKNVAPENTSIHAGTYYSTVEGTTADTEVVPGSGLTGADKDNYVLKKVKYSYQFKIEPKRVALEWYRPTYNEYGENHDENPDVSEELVKVESGNPKLVFNGKKQAPFAKVKEGELEHFNGATDEDECDVTVRGPSDAIETGEYDAEKIDLSNSDYTADESGTTYEIIQHPVRISWKTLETTYNGEAQEGEPSITNIQKNAKGRDFVNDEGVTVEISRVDYEEGYHFGINESDTDESDSSFEGETGYYNEDGSEEKGMAEGSSIAEDRTPIDAGTYVMTAAELSDPFNYTLIKLNPETMDPAVIEKDGEVVQDAYVDFHHPIYTIHQYEINTIDWRNTTVTYNASWQKPIAEVNKSDLQGPDTNKEVAVMITDNLDRIKEEDFLGFCNAKNGYPVYVFKNEGDTPHRGIKGTRSMNYFIGDSAQKMQINFIINKKPLTVTVYNKTGYYGDNPTTYKHTVKYTGLINGNVNTDDNHQNKNIPGKYNPSAPAEGELKNVVEGTLKYTTNYKKWGKPGKYNIKASGLKSDNYAIKYVAGTLTIKDRFLLGDFVTKAIAGNKKATIYWRRVNGAAKYRLYFSLCDRNGKKYTPKLYKTFGSKTASFTMKGLESHTYYKYYLVALDSKGKAIARTHQHHFCTNNSYGGYTNPKSITGLRKSVTLNKGKTYKLKPTVNKVISWKKLTNGSHTLKLRYKSGNNNVATVSSNGTIKAVGTGWCRVYAMAANGIWYDVEVNVK